MTSWWPGPVRNRPTLGGTAELSCANINGATVARLRGARHGGGASDAAPAASVRDQEQWFRAALRRRDAAEPALQRTTLRAEGNRVDVCCGAIRLTGYK